ncbi:MAG: helix-turn-helix transcriptional regulator [Clostridia bacterium]|nr:helix-turn-helix transcriptional regulator [Clostridia bacterium]
MEFKLKNLDSAIAVTRLANIHYFEFTKQYHTTGDRHSFRELVYVDNGTIYVEAENFSGELIKNQLIIHKNNELHSLYCDSHIPPDVIIIGFECESVELDRFSEKPATLSSDMVRMLTEVVREGRNVFEPPYDVPNIKDMKKKADTLFGADQLLKIYFELFLINLIRNQNENTVKESILHDFKKTQEIRNYIENNYCKNITLDELCFLFSTNKTTLCNHFKESYGTTIIDYVNRKRIQQAKIKLREGNENITQISLNLGFNSIHYFSRLFKKYENISPTEYVATIRSRLGI